MNRDARSIERLLESWSRGEVVDWERADRGAHDDDDRAQVRALRDVARIADFSRSLQHSALGTDPDAPERWGALLILEHVGAGANGDVYRAWDPSLQREVALKLLRAPAAAGGDLIGEARALARVRHPDVATVFGVAEHDGRVGMWMEFLRGASLAAEVERRGALPAGEVIRIGVQLARALAAIHAAGLVHRDVKPANVVLEAAERAVITDFGLGLRADLTSLEALTASGTPMFMSPARLDGQPATPPDDVYALAATLWNALFGAPPFAAHTLAELRAAVREGPSAAVRAQRPEAPAALVRVLERALAPDPARRIARAEELAAALEALGAEAATPAPRRVSAFAWAAVTAVVLASLALWLALRSRAPHASPAPAASSAPAVAPGAYDVSAALVRRSEGGYERLSPGDRVRPGDRLSLEFHATRRVWLYVLNEDEQGAAFLLFPTADFDQQNPLAAETTLVLPGLMHGQENAWTVTSRGGREHFLVVASPEPIAELEAGLADLPAVSPDRAVRYAPVSAGTVERLRGVGGVRPLPAATPARRAGVFEQFRALAGRERGVTGVWTREITLENPLH